MTLRPTRQNLAQNPPENGGQSANLPATLSASRSLASPPLVGGVGRASPGVTISRPNTLAGLAAKLSELRAYRDQLEADIRAVTVDIDHLEAAIRIFDPEDTPAARRRYAALHRAPKGQSTRFILRALREASGPLTSRALADMWCADRGLTAKASTVSMLRKRLGATLKALEHKGLVYQNGFVDGLIAWRLA